MVHPGTRTCLQQSASGRSDNQDKAIDPRDRTLLKVTLPILPPGKYKVFWRVLSVDTHTTDGTFTFEVAP